MTKPSAKPFKVAFIGFGGIAVQHANYFKKIPGVEMVAAADINPERHQKAKEHGISRTYDDFKELLAKETDIDAVTVCTPNGFHAPHAIGALEAGRHVLVEKPMAMNATEGQAMVDAAKKSGKNLVIGFQYRFDPKSTLIHNQVETGKFGKVMYVRCQALRRRGIPNWGVFGRKDLQGGGPMIDIGVHSLEMAHYMMGSPKPVAAFGNTWTFLGNKPSSVKSTWPNWDHKTYSVEDMAIGMIRFDTGALLTIEASFVAHIEKDIWTVNLMGEQGGANWETGQIFRDVDDYMMSMTPNYLGNDDIWDHKMRHFVEVCRDGRKCMSSGEQGLMVQKMLDGVYASAAAGKEVAI